MFRLGVLLCPSCLVVTLPLVQAVHITTAPQQVQQAVLSDQYQEASPASNTAAAQQHADDLDCVFRSMLVLPLSTKVVDRQGYASQYANDPRGYALGEIIAAGSFWIGRMQTDMGNFENHEGNLLYDYIQHMTRSGQESAMFSRDFFDSPTALGGAQARGVVLVSLLRRFRAVLEDVIDEAEFEKLVVGVVDEERGKKLLQLRLRGRIDEIRADRARREALLAAAETRTSSDRGADPLTSQERKSQCSGHDAFDALAWWRERINTARRELIRKFPRMFAEQEVHLHARVGDVIESHSVVDYPIDRLRKNWVPYQIPPNPEDRQTDPENYYNTMTMYFTAPVEAYGALAAHLKRQKILDETKTLKVVVHSSPYHGIDVHRPAVDASLQRSFEFADLVGKEFSAHFENVVVEQRRAADPRQELGPGVHRRPRETLMRAALAADDAVTEAVLQATTAFAGRWGNNFGSFAKLLAGVVNTFGVGRGFRFKRGVFPSQNEGGSVSECGFPVLPVEPIYPPTTRGSLSLAYYLSVFLATPCDPGVFAPTTDRLQSTAYTKTTLEEWVESNNMPRETRDKMVWYSHPEDRNAAFVAADTTVEASRLALFEKVLQGFSKGSLHLRRYSAPVWKTRKGVDEATLQRLGVSHGLRGIGALVGAVSITKQSSSPAPSFPASSTSAGRKDGAGEDGSDVEIPPELVGMVEMKEVVGFTVPHSALLEAPGTTIGAAQGPTLVDVLRDLILRAEDQDFVVQRLEDKFAQLQSGPGSSNTQIECVFHARFAYTPAALLYEKFPHDDVLDCYFEERIKKSRRAVRFTVTKTHGQHAGVFLSVDVMDKSAVEEEESGSGDRRKEERMEAA